MTRINLIGGSAYSSTGGIQAMNRLLVRELAELGRLDQAHFLWDARIRLEGVPAAVQGYGLRRGAFLAGVLTAALRHPRALWLATHVNYSPVAFVAAFGRSRRAGVLLHAAELDDNFTAAKGGWLRRAGWVVAVSDYTKHKAVRLGVKPERVYVLPNGVLHHDETAALSAPDPARPVLLFVGRMDDRYKGQRELIDAMTLLRDRWPSLRLVFVGSGSSLAKWQAEADRQRLGDSVVFAGRVSDAELDRLYAAATVFAMPSENEGFGLVYAEAMAHGVPCIGSERDAAREVIRHGETGLCVPANNATVLADAIASLLRSPALRARMGQAAHERYLREFTPQRYRARLGKMLTAWEGFATGMKETEAARAAGCA